MNSTCYMCEREATTFEHVPPKCLFPEAKDVRIDMRKDLIRVPSCREHNNGKSDDDAFLMVSLAGIIGSNSIGYRHKFTKINRALKREAYRQLDEVFLEKKIFLVEWEKNAFIDVIYGTPAYARLGSCFDRVARGLYYHKTKTRFLGDTKTLLGFTINRERNPAEFMRMVRDLAEKELTGKPRLGANPDVFNYQFTDPDNRGIFLLHLNFYGGLDVYISMASVGADIRPNLAMELMNRGIHTILRDGDKTYIFNENQE